MPTTAHAAPEWVADLLASLPPLLTIDEAKDALRCSKRNVYRRLALGELESVRRDRSQLIPRASIVKFLRGGAA